jgi:hypothetical protein
VRVHFVRHTSALCSRGGRRRTLPVRAERRGRFPSPESSPRRSVRGGTPRLRPSRERCILAFRRKCTLTPTLSRRTGRGGKRGTSLTVLAGIGVLRTSTRFVRANRCFRWSRLDAPRRPRRGSTELAEVRRRHYIGLRCGLRRFAGRTDVARRFSTWRRRARRLRGRLATGLSTTRDVAGRIPPTPVISSVPPPCPLRAPVVPFSPCRLTPRPRAWWGGRRGRRCRRRGR